MPKARSKKMPKVVSLKASRDSRRLVEHLGKFCEVRPSRDDERRLMLVVWVKPAGWKIAAALQSCSFTLITPEKRSHALKVLRLVPDAGNPLRLVAEIDLPRGGALPEARALVVAGKGRGAPRRELVNAIHHLREQMLGG